jgi:predicted Rossmann fold nucleotide-binding protein DprA/Smf involved in DNA uptake
VSVGPPTLCRGATESSLQAPTAIEPRRARLSPAAEGALERLRDGPLTADELVRAAGLSAAEGSAALLELELSGSVSIEDGVYRAAV